MGQMGISAYIHTIAVRNKQFRPYRTEIRAKAAAFVNTCCIGCVLLLRQRKSYHHSHEEHFAMSVLQLSWWCRMVPKPYIIRHKIHHRCYALSYLNGWPQFYESSSSVPRRILVNKHCLILLIFSIMCICLHMTRLLHLITASHTHT
jgi:hypothetical protein